MRPASTARVEPEASRGNYYKYIAMPARRRRPRRAEEALARGYDVGLSGEVYERRATSAGVRPVARGPAACRRGAVRASHLSARVGRDDRRGRDVRRRISGTRARRDAHGGGGEMRVAVTGGCGFIGSHVVDKLRDAGPSKCACSTRWARRIAGTSSTLPVDIMDRQALIDAMRGIDVIFHLAAVADVNNVAADPAGSVALNVLGTANVLEAAREHEARRVVLASTVWVYGAAREAARGRSRLLRRCAHRPCLHIDEDRGRDALPRLSDAVRRAVYGPALRHPLRPAYAPVACHPASSCARPLPASR